MTLAGLRSRCVTCFRCAAASASASATAISKNCARETPPCGITWSSVRPWNQFHGHEPDAVGLLGRRNRDDVRVIEGGNGACLAFEARQTVGVEREGIGKNLQRNITIQFRVARAVDLPHAPSADALMHLVSCRVAGRSATEARGLRRPAAPLTAKRRILRENPSPTPAAASSNSTSRRSDGVAGARVVRETPRVRLSPRDQRGVIELLDSLPALRRHVITPPPARQDEDRPTRSVKSAGSMNVESILSTSETSS